MKNAFYYWNLIDISFLDLWIFNWLFYFFSVVQKNLILKQLNYKIEYLNKDKII
jgi:hypothetical protein